MKIKEQTGGKMVLEEFSILAYVVGVVFILTGIYMLTDATIEWWWGALFVIVGLIPIAIYQSTTVTIDKIRGRLTVFKKGLVRSGQVDECGLDEIEAIEYMESYYNSDGTTMRKVRLSALRKGRSRVILAEPPSKGGSLVHLMRGGKKPNMEIGQKMADFIGVPLKEVGPPSAREVLGAIREGIEKGMERARKD